MSNTHGQQSSKNGEKASLTSWRILLFPLLTALRFLTSQVEKLVGVERSQESAPITKVLPPIDKEVKRLLQELRLMPSEWEQDLFERWWLPFAVLIPVAVLFLLGLMQDIYLYLNYWQEKGIQFHLENAVHGLDVIYMSFAVMLMAIVWFYRRYLRLVPSALRGLWDNSLLSSKTETGTTDGISPAAKFLRRYKAALESRSRFMMLGVVMIGIDAILAIYIAKNFSLSFQSFLSTTFTLFLVLKWFVFPQLWMWIALTAGWPMLVTAYYLRRLTEDFDLEVIPSHPDQCGGLKPIGDICLQLAMIVLVASLALGYWGSAGRMLRVSGILPQVSAETPTEVILNPTREAQPITRMLANVGTLCGIIGGVGLFFYPMLGIHGDMKKKKAGFAQELADAAAEFDHDFEEAIKTGDGAQIKDAQGQLETLQSTYSLLKGYPEWPINWRTLLKFLTPQFFSILGLFISFNSDNLQLILGWLGFSGGG